MMAGLAGSLLLRVAEYAFLPIDGYIITLIRVFQTCITDGLSLASVSHPDGVYTQRLHITLSFVICSHVPMYRPENIRESIIVPK